MAQPEPGGEYHAPGWGSVILSFFYEWSFASCSFFRMTCQQCETESKRKRKKGGTVRRKTIIYFLEILKYLKGEKIQICILCEYCTYLRSRR